MDDRDLICNKNRCMSVYGKTHSYMHKQKHPEKKNKGHASFPVHQFYIFYLPVLQRDVRFPTFLKATAAFFKGGGFLKT